MNMITKTFCGMLLGAMAVGSHAASLSLVYTGANPIDDDNAVVAQINDVLTFDIVMDFTDDPTIGGGFDVVFDTSVFAFDSYTNNDIGEDGFGRDPDVMSGLLESWAFGGFAGVGGPDIVGSVSFVYLGGIGEILLTATSGIAGPFVSLANPGATMNVDFGSAAVVPLPAAAWFFLSGLGALFGVRGRAARTRS
jgi:hypothetical protein